jgi:hypothetical protein
MAGDADSTCLVSPQPVPATPPSPEVRQQVIQKFESCGVSSDVIKSASATVASFLQELNRNCGSQVKKEVVDDVAKGGEELAQEDAVDQEDGQSPNAEEAAPPQEEKAEEVEGDAPPAVDEPFDVGAVDAQLDDAKSSTAANAETSASLLSFVIGNNNAAAGLENAFQVSGDELSGGPEGPSLAYPACCYEYGCLPPKPWGIAWDNQPKRTEVVAFVAHARKLFAIAARILIGVDDEAYLLDREVLDPEEEEAAKKIQRTFRNKKTFDKNV